MPSDVREKMVKAFSGGKDPTVENSWGAISVPSWMGHGCPTLRMEEAAPPTLAVGKVKIWPLFL